MFKKFALNVRGVLHSKIFGLVAMVLFLLCVAAPVLAEQQLKPHAVVADIVIMPRNYIFTWGTSGANIAGEHPGDEICSWNPDTWQVLYWRTNDGNSSAGVNDWNPTISVAGDYDIYVFVPDYPHTAPITTQAKYYFNGGLLATLDQNQNRCQWVYAGRRWFSAGTGDTVSMPAQTSDNPWRLIAGDSLKLVYVEPPRYTLSGRVADTANNAIPGVTVSLSTGAVTTTDASGNYAFGGLLAGSYTVTPSRSGDAFNPASRQVTISGNTGGVNFTRTTTYSISGRVADTANNAIPGVTVSLNTGAVTTTDGSGNYAFGGLLAGSYTVTPSRSGDAFNPASRQVTISGNTGGVNFTRTNTYSISGRVADAANNAIPGVTVSFNTGASTTTDASGNYALVGLLAGSYTVTPSQAGDTFSPESRQVTLSGNTGGIDFTVTTRYTITGRLSDANGAPIAGVTVTCQGLTTQGNAVSNSAGEYTIANLAPGLYQVRPDSSVHTFSPSVRGWMYVPPSQSGQDFSAVPVYGGAGGKVTEEGSGAAVSGARVNIAGKVVQTDAGGNYSLAGALPGIHAVYVSAAGYHDYQGSAVIQANVTTTHNVTLTKVAVDGYRLPFPGGQSYALNRTPRAANRYAQEWGLGSGRDVVASRAGKVKYVEDTHSEYGCRRQLTPNYVAIQHSDGMLTWYVHLAQGQVYVQPGELVKAGQVIAKTGLSGYMCGRPPDHLYFAYTDLAQKRFVPAFLDVSTNGGVPLAGHTYTSGNYLDAALLAGDDDPTADTTPPAGSVRFSLTGQPTYNVIISAFDYDSLPLEMRLATSESALASAAWQPLADSIAWTDPVVFGQLKDAAGNLSPVYSDVIEQIAYEPLQPDFSVAATICAYEEFDVQNRSFPLCEQCGWSWEMGEGTTTHGMEPYWPVPAKGFSYPDPGRYTITLTGVNANSSGAASHEVEVAPAPSSDFTITRAGLTVWVAALDTTADAWQWDFGDGATVSGQAVSHTYDSQAALAQTAVKLTTALANGCTSSTYRTAPEPVYIFLPITMR